MNNIAILKSRHLIEHEGTTSTSSGYKWSKHKEHVEAFIEACKSYNIPYFVWGEEDLNGRSLSTKKITTILVPQMRVCSEATFQALHQLAADGMIVFTTCNSFYYDRRESLPPKRAIETRCKELFQLSEKSQILSCELCNSQITFNNTRFHWLTEGMPSKLPCHHVWTLCVSGASDTLKAHGHIEANELCDKKEEREKIGHGKVFPAFLIREFPSGGMFIYSCFPHRGIKNYKPIIRNIAKRGASSPQSNQQIRILKIMILALTGVLGLLIAKDMVGDSWQVYLGGVIGGTVIGLICNKLTNIIKEWI